MALKEIKYINRSTGEIELEKTPGEKLLKFLYYHPLGKLMLHTLVKRKFLSSFYGRLMNKKGSKKRIKPFIESFAIDENEFLKPTDTYDTFNEFFFRELKEGSREVQKGLVSPADGKILAFESLNHLKDFFIKGEKFTLMDFLQDKQLASNFSAGSMIIVRLAPPDYHRFHFPYQGQIKKPIQISGTYYSVSPYSVMQNFARVFCENKRSANLLVTKEKGDILLCPVGATMVGSIIHTYESYSNVKKGGEMGYFAFGGSTLVILTQKDQFKLDSDIIENTKRGFETSIKMGETIAI